MGSAGDGQEGLRDRQTGAGRGGEKQKFRGRGRDRDRQTDTHTHMCPLISWVISFPGATLPWASAFPTLGQDPQPLTFCVGWLVPHNFFCPPPGMAGSDPRSRGSCQGRAKPANPHGFLTSSPPGSCLNTGEGEGEYGVTESCLRISSGFTPPPAVDTGSSGPSTSHRSKLWCRQM